MAKESNERKKIKASLLKKGDSLLFPERNYIKISRMLQDMNRLARANRDVKPDDVLYSVQREGAPNGKFFVIRNL